MKWAVVLACALTTFQVPSFACAQDRIAPADSTYLAPLRYTIEHAARIARVRITAREPLHGDAIGQTPVCAYLMSATVVEAFKGNAAPFNFISAVATDFPELGRDYLVVADAQPGVSEATKLALGKLTERRDATSEQMACLLRQLSVPGYYVPSLYQTSWQFDTEARQNFGGEWLTASTRADGLFCGLRVREYRERSAHPAFRTRQIGSTDHQRYVVAWSDVRQLLGANATTSEVRFPCE